MHSRTANENTMVPSDVDRLIDPKTIFRKALLHNANSIIVAHNHPSGNLRPSQEDLDIYGEDKGSREDNNNKASGFYYL